MSQVRNGKCRSREPVFETSMEGVSPHGHLRSTDPQCQPGLPYSSPWSLSDPFLTFPSLQVKLRTAGQQIFLYSNMIIEAFHISLLPPDRAI